MALTAKDRHKLRLLEYLGNPDNDYLPRCRMSVDVMGLAMEDGIYKVFTPDEITEIEREALEIRRTKYARFLAGVDMGQLKKAIEGDTAAAQLVYKRLEGWSEKIKNEIMGKDGDNIKVDHQHTMDIGALEKAMGK